MKKMKLFIDTHDKRKKTFPEKISREEFAAVFKKYAQACSEEGVVIVNTLFNFQDGRMFCVNMAETAEAVKRAHDKVGLPYDEITELTTASPGDIYFKENL